MLFIGKILPKVCQNVNRVVYAFGGLIQFPVQDITPTYLTSIILSTLRQADHLAHEVGCT